MENAENTARLPSSVKRILWILLAVLILALGAVIGWYVLHFRNYDAYKAIPLQPAAYTEGKVFEPLQDSLKAVPGFQLAAENGNMAPLPRAGQLRKNGPAPRPDRRPSADSAPPPVAGFSRKAAVTGSPN